MNRELVMCILNIKKGDVAFGRVRNSVKHTQRACHIISLFTKRCVFHIFLVIHFFHVKALFTWGSLLPPVRVLLFNKSFYSK